MNKLLKLTTLSLLLGLTFQANGKELSDKFLRQTSEKYALPETPMPVSKIKYYKELQYLTNEEGSSEPTLTSKYSLINDDSIHPTQYRNIFKIDTQETFAIYGSETGRSSGLSLYHNFHALSTDGLTLDNDGQLTRSVKMHAEKVFISHLPSQWLDRITPFETRTEYRIDAAPSDWKQGKKITAHSICHAFPIEAVQDYPQSFPKNVDGVMRRVECKSFGYNQQNQLYLQMNSVGFWLENYQLMVPFSIETHWEGEKSFTRTYYRMLDFKP